jgi:GT2 family glycosyltransferase
MPIELTSTAADVYGLEQYRELRALIRLHGSPIGVVRVPIRNGRCSASAIRRAACDQLSWPIVRHLLMDTLAGGISDPAAALAALGQVVHQPSTGVSQSMTVAVCTRDRPEDLARCLDALTALTSPPDEILVVDNAPTSDATERVVARYRGVRYVREPRPGLDWARNRAVTEASGDILAFTDDDVVVDPEWTAALRKAFADRPDAAAATGLVLPYELETEAQELFERYGGFGRGFQRRWFRVDDGESAAALHGGTGKFGTGANMAFRRSVFAEIGGFDPALDVGTVTNGGGDLEMFYRVLAAGHVLIYEPDAIVWHRHRRDYAKLREQLANNGIGFYSYLVRSALASPRDRWSFARLGVWWFGWWNLRRLAISFFKPGAFPRDLILAELFGVFRGLFRYQKAWRAAREMDGDAGSVVAFPRGRPNRPATAQGGDSSSIRVVDVGVPVGGLPDTSAHSAIGIVVIRDGRLIGTVRVDNRRRPVSPVEVRQAIADSLGIDVFNGDVESDRGTLWNAALDAAKRAFLPARLEGPEPLPASVNASIVVATYDRPADLRRALASLTRQRTKRAVEIVVVDNHPASQLTPRVVADFPSVRLVSEPRGGLSYARNAGIAASTGAIVVATDDDVVAPPDWIETLLAPFTDEQVMAVTGNVLAADLSKPSQRLFESYGGLGRGLAPFNVDCEWFWSFRQAVPTWTVGATANAAFRASIFHHPAIGLFDESLGAGTATGCSEDTDMFYRVLRAGFRIVYEPQAFVWHHHRGTMEALRWQIYSYAKGHVAYQLNTLTRHRDLRALVRLAVELPRVYFWRVKERLRGRSSYPFSFVLLELAGTVMGPFAWWQSRRRVKRLGRSAPYVPVPDRLIESASAAAADSTRADLIA